MAWPTGTVSTTNLDAPTDDPSQARADLKTAVDKLNEAIGARGAANGVASLDGTTKVPAAQIPDIDDDKLDGSTDHGGFAAYTAPGDYNFTVPAGVYLLGFELSGGGGGGGYSNTKPHGGGGGAGGGVRGKMVVQPGWVLNIHIGAGGAGGAMGGVPVNGGTGEASTITTTGISVTAYGGVGGQVPSGSQGGSWGVTGLTTCRGCKGGLGSFGDNRGGVGGTNEFCGGQLTGATDANGGGGGNGSGETGGAGNSGACGHCVITY